jgi:hypothetical protein
MNQSRIAFLVLFVAQILCAQAPKPSKASKNAVPAGPPPSVVSMPEEELLVIKQTPYRPTLTRDPYRAPSDLELSKQGDLIDDIGVKGRVVTNGKVMVLVTDSRGNTRPLSVGYRFRDGEIVAIEEKEVVFHQWDVSSTNRSVFRTVRKPFKREEGKR